jgi:hypothetical protein
MVVDDFDFVRMSSAPYEADAPLIVDTNAVLPVSIPFQALEAVSWQRRQRSDLRSGIEDVQVSKRRALDCFEPACTFPAKQALGIRAAEWPDHCTMLYCFPFHVNQHEHGAWRDSGMNLHPAAHFPVDL